MLVGVFGRSKYSYANACAVNAAILGTVGYFAYKEWNRPTWDRRIVTAVSVGLLTLWSGEGYVRVVRVIDSHSSKFADTLLSNTARHTRWTSSM